MTQRLLILSDKIRKALDLPQVVNITDELPHHPVKKWPKRDFNLLQGITIHHFASEAPIRNQALYHVNAHGWVGLAYSIVIRDGQIFQTNYLDDRTTHASGGNDISWGVCIGGDLSKRSMTDSERRALTGVCIALKEHKEGLWVKGHNQISKTSCPCTDMNRIREDIEAAEEDLDYRESTPYLNAEVFAFFERFSALETRMTKFPAESRRKIMRMAPVMAELGHEGDMTPESILKRIKEVRASAIVNGRWSDEGRRKAAKGAKYAKEVGLLG